LPSGRQYILLLPLAMLALSVAAILYDVIDIGPAVALMYFMLAWILSTTTISTAYNFCCLIRTT
jgi:hypothetical protein